MNSCLKEENLQAYLDGELALEAGEAVRGHLAACSHCAAAAQEMEQAFAVLGSAFAAELPDEAPTTRMRARIESALAEKTTPKFAWAQLFWRFGWVAAMLLMVGIVSWTLRGTHSIKQPQQAHNEKPKSTITPESRLPLSPKPERQPELAQQPRLRHRLRHRAIGNDSEEAEVVTQFFALREGEDLTAVENMQVVRVELPGTALGEVGLPVPLETSGTTIKADVALGDDGLARAIRFIR